MKTSNYVHACTCDSTGGPLSCCVHNPTSMTVTTDEYGTTLDKLDMAERIAHEVSTHNPEEFNYHPHPQKHGYLTIRTVHGRITLADILHTFMRKGFYFSFEHNFRLKVWGKDMRDLGSTEWDCSIDDLDRQEETTVRFLYNTLCSFLPYV